MSEWTEVTESKVWVSRLSNNTGGNFVDLNWTCKRPEIEYINASLYNWEKVSDDQAPQHLFFMTKRNFQSQ